MTQRSKFKSKQAQRYLAYKDQIGWQAKAAGITPSNRRCTIKVTVYMKSKPDIDVDNLAKAYMDGLNKIAWEDDKQVVLLHISKHYVKDAKEERAEIEIREETE